MEKAWYSRGIFLNQFRIATADDELLVPPRVDDK
jgi:hypothetical protein